MAQHDQDIANAAGATVRSDINAALAALFSLSSGASAPSVTIAYMLWLDTANGLLKQRNSTNTAWITLWAADSAPGNTAGAGSSVNGNAVIFSGTTGKILADAGYVPAGQNNANTFTLAQTFSALMTIGGPISQTIQTLTDGATITWDLDNGNAAKVTLGGTGRTLASSGTLRAGSYKLFVKMDATGGRSITTYPSWWTWLGGTPTFNTTANKMNVIGIESDGTTGFAALSQE